MIIIRLKGYGNIFRFWLFRIRTFEVIVISFAKFLVTCLVYEIWKDK